MMISKDPFLPPKTNLLAVRLFHAILPWLLGRFRLSVKIPPSVVETLKALKTNRILLLPNHPTPDDPLVLFALSRKLGMPFNFVAAREVFNWEGGLRGKLFQWLGVYSVIRGIPDRQSFMTTKNVLVAGEYPLVIFIEGEISRQNATLFPFEPGVLQIALKAQQTLNEKKPDEAIYAVPVALQYDFHVKPADIEQALARLEKAVRIKSDHNLSIYKRLRNIGEVVLKTQEMLLHLPFNHPESPQCFGLPTLDERLMAYKHRLLRNIERFLEVIPSDEHSILDRVRVVRNKLDREIHAYEPNPQPLSDYEKRVRERLEDQLRGFYQDLEKLTDVLTLQEGYIAEAPTEGETMDRVVEVLLRLEKEVFGEVKLQYAKTVTIQLVPPVNLAEALPNYQQQKTQFLDTLVFQLEEAMKQLLHG